MLKYCRKFRIYLRSPFFNEGFEIKIMVDPNLQKEREKIKKFVENKWINEYLFNDRDRLAALNDPLFLECCDCEEGFLNTLILEIF